MMSECSSGAETISSLANPQATNHNTPKMTIAIPLFRLETNAMSSEGRFMASQMNKNENELAADKRGYTRIQSKTRIQFKTKRGRF